MKGIQIFYTTVVHYLKEKRQKPPDDIRLPQRINFLNPYNFTDTSPFFIFVPAHVESIKTNWKPPPDAPILAHANSEYLSHKHGDIMDEKKIG